MEISPCCVLQQLELKVKIMRIAEIPLLHYEDYKRDWKTQFVSQVIELITERKFNLIEKVFTTKSNYCQLLTTEKIKIFFFNVEFFQRIVNECVVVNE